MPAVPFSKAGGAAPEDTQWNWDAETQNAILGTDGDDWTSYKAAHSWWDGDSDAEAKSHYKLPHHRKGDDGLEAVWHGVSNAMARLESADIPEDEVKATFDHLAKHYPQWEKQPPEYDRFLRRWRERRALAATRSAPLPLVMTRVAITTARLHGAPTENDLALINQQARSPLAADQVYVIPAEISNQSVDAYSTRMTPLSLANYADDATRGVAVCDSHTHYQMPIGRSYYGQLAPDQQGQGQATQALAYMLRGMALPSGMRSDDYIAGMESGIYQDVSIGFIPLAYWCSICGCNMLSGWDCNHWPGQTYEVKDQGEVVCIADVDANLAEFSLVYDGATPNAMLLKAQHELDGGRATSRQLAFVEDRCRVKLFERYPGFTPSQSRKDDDMKGSEFVARFMQALQTRAGKEISQANLDRLQAIHDQLREGHDTMDEALRAMADFMDEKNGTVTADPDNDGDLDTGPQGSTDDPDGDGTEDGAGQSGVYGTGASSGGRSTPETRAPAAPRLTQDERDAIAFAGRIREEAIGAALKAGVRAMGAAFNEERYTAILQRSTYDEIRQCEQDWEAQAKGVLSPRGTWDAKRGAWTTEPTASGGRQTAARDPNDPVGLRTTPRAGRREKVHTNLYKA